ncbi:MAG TPA: thioesterase family protein [Fimbriimonas sp.]
MKSGGIEGAGGYQFVKTLAVPSSDIDEMGHVNNVAYLRYVEAAAREHSESVGLDIERYRELGGVFVVRKHTVVYHRPARLGETLDLRTRVVASAGVRATREVHIYRGEELLVEASTDWVWVDPESYRPKRIPAEIHAALPPV